MATDFDQAPTGRRLRIPMTVYDAESRSFRAVPDAVALITVANEKEQRRLWKAIEAAIGDEGWRNERAPGGADRVEPAQADV